MCVRLGVTGREGEHEPGSSRLGQRETGSRLSKEPVFGLHVRTLRPSRELKADA